jgi:UDP-2-acetamido-3-amino-2,3-dideoxy-glucuronate N-acetyltransferase
MKPEFSRIADDVVLGKNVKIHGFVNLYGCEIGDDSRIGVFVEIQKEVVIGKRVKVQSHCFICSGVVVEDEAFIGHGVMFINDPFPRSTREDGALQGEADWTCVPTRIGRRASIGSNATILCGVTVGQCALVGAGSVVTKDVPPYAVVVGNPAHIVRYLNVQAPTGT